MTRTLTLVAVLTSLLLLAPSGTGALAASQGGTGTPSEMVETYSALADSILAIDKTEVRLVHAILATTFGHGEATLAAIKKKIGAGQNARAEIEALADLATQLGNEGDAAVAAVRKRLVEGGHHHNSQGEQQGVYEEGFVVVTRAAKKVFLAAAGNIARMSAAPDAAKLEAEWAKVASQYKALVAGA